MTSEVKIIEATTNNGKAIYTFQLKYWRGIHSEMMTHRVFSRNASSTRAIPVMKTIKQVWNEPAMPVYWGENKAGMQAGEELVGTKLKAAKFLWRLSGKLACILAHGMVKLGLHKQIAGRILEPWQYIHVVLTGTEFENFFNLRIHKDAQPEIQELAAKMKQAMDQCTPREVSESSINHRHYHLPYVSIAERTRYNIQTCLQFSAARCARVSYLTHDNRYPKPEEDLKLYDRLVGSEPRHASPVEHQAHAALNEKYKSNNFTGWVQQREVLESVWKK